MNAAEQRRLDEYYMRMALSLALRGTGTASPNPRVGCVIVRNGNVIGRGWHALYGGAHAEVNAVADAGGDVAGAVVYVTLEPCCHYGKTPPCAKMLIDHKVSRVVAGMTDPNPLVDCGGIALLQKNGIDCVSGVLERECRWINRGFIRSMNSGRPWVAVKCGASLDGDISLKDGSSKWITGSLSREKVHMLRAECDAVLTGAGTIWADDPQLTVRDAEGRTPLRVLLDRKLSSPVNASFFKGGNVIVFTGDGVSQEKADFLKSMDVKIITIPAFTEDEFDFVLKKLCDNGVNYLLIEAGAHITSSIIASGYADEMILFSSPKLMGNGVRFSEYLEVSGMDKTVLLKDVTCEQSGCDLCIKGVFSCSPDL